MEHILENGVPASTYTRTYQDGSKGSANTARPVLGPLKNAFVNLDVV